MEIEQTLVIIKPETSVRRYVSTKVLSSFIKEEFNIYGFKRFKVPRTLAEKHYEIHQGKFFYEWLVNYISSTPIITLIVEGEDAISRVRNLLGATLVQKAAPDSLRGKYGVWGGANVAHASDGKETARNEINLWLTAGNLDKDTLSNSLVDQYISEWSRDPIDQTKELQSVCLRLNQDPNLKQEVYNEILKIINSEAREEEPKDIKNLTRLLVQNALPND